MTSSGDDKAFGPQFGSWFDFTLKFEQTMLTILPTGLLIAATPLYLWLCSKQPVHSRQGPILWTKLTAAFGLLAVEVAILILYARTPAIRTDTAMAASSLSCAGSVTIAALIFAEHRHALRPTSLFSVYTVLSLAIDAVKSRSYFLRHDLQALGVLAAVAGTLKLAIVILQEVPKRHLLLDKKLRETVGKEATSGFWYRNFFAWVNSLFAKGSRGAVSIDDLDSLGPDLSSRTLLNRFSTIWEERKNVRPNFRLAMSCFYTLWWPFLAVIIPRLMYSGFTFSQTFLLKRILKCISDENPTTYEKLGLLAATAIIFFGRAMSKNIYTHANYRLITMTRGVMVSSMAQKQLRLPHSEAKKSAIATLMAADVEGVAEGLPDIHSLWAHLLETGLGLFVLSRLIGVASVVIFIPFFSSVGYGSWVGRSSGKALDAWNSNIQSRVSKMSAILPQILPIKMTGLGPVVTDFAQKLRVTEMDYSKKFRVYVTATIAGGVGIDAMTPVIVLIAAIFWTKFLGGFTAEEAFPILSVVVLIQTPLFGLMDSFASMPPLWACMNRIQAFLQLPEWRDERECDDDNNEPAGEKGDNNSPVIALRDVDISVPGKGEPLFQKINLDLMKAKTVALLGPISCGKSTFLKTLIGEGQLRSGGIKVKNRKMAYCSQAPLLPNVSIRNNVVGPAEYDDKLYWTIMEACQLVDDLQQMPSGDKTLVGSDGMSLSVGQRARVALATAAYARMEVLIVDDIFSSLDQKTTRSILKEMFGACGLMRQWNTTVLIASHLGVVLDVADEVLLFKGTSISHHKEFDSNDLKKDLITTVDTSEQIPETSAEAQRNGKAALQKLQKSSDKAADSEDADPSLHSQGELGLYKFYFRSIKKWRFFLWIGVMVAVTLCDSFPPGYIRIWVETAPERTVWLIGYALFAVFNSILALWGQRLFYLDLLPESGEKLHHMLLGATMGATYNFISTVESSYLLNRFSQDMNFIVQVLPIALYKCVYMLFSVLIELGFVFSGATYTLAILPFLGAAVYYTQSYYLRTSQQLRHLDLEAKTPLLVSFKEASNALHQIRSHGWTDSHLDRCMTILDDSQKAYYQMFCIQRWLNLVLDLMVGAIAIALVGIGLYVRKSTSPAAMGLSYLVLIEFGDTITNFIRRWTEMETSLGSIGRLRSFIQKTPQEQDSNTALLPENWPSAGKITFKNVTAAYNSDPVLKDVSFEIRSGDKVSMMGRSGSGKSSTLVTLLNFLEYSGSICIDDVDITTVPRQRLRMNITTITQTPVILSGSIRDNLTPFHDASSRPSDSRIEEILRDLGLWEAIESKGGLDMQLDEAGLSAAHQQLLCIARAVLHHEHTRSRIVIMDEATASLSLASTNQVQRVIEEAFDDCTVLSVAHWDSPLDNPDLTLKFASGKLVSAERAAE